MNPHIPQNAPDDVKFPHVLRSRESCNTSYGEGRFSKFEGNLKGKKTMPDQNQSLFDDQSHTGCDDQHPRHQADPLSHSERVRSGRRHIVDLAFMMEEFHRALDIHLENGICKFRHIHLHDELKRGLRTSFRFRCSQCELILIVNSEPDESEYMDLNHAAVSGLISAGIGFAQFEEVTASMAIVCFSGKSQRKYQEHVQDALGIAAVESMKEAGRLEVQLAIKRNDMCGQIPCTKVVADGVWGKRSYRTGAHNSLSGTGIIVGKYSGKVLFFGVKNSYCCICSRAKNLGLPPKPHRCFKNFEGSASSMETLAIWEGFQHSLDQHGLVYTHLIADGDSSITKQLEEKPPYSHLNIRIRKIECYNHLLRRLVIMLKEIGSGDRSLAVWRKMIEANCLRMRTDIMAAVDYWRKQGISEEEQIKNLQKDCKNIPHHVFGDHQECARYFCNGRLKATEMNHVPAMTTAGMFTKIEHVFERVISNCDSLIMKLNNNLCEICNSVHAKTVAGKRINFSQRGSYTARVCAAVVQFNGQNVLQCTARAMGKTPTQFVQQLEDGRKARNDAANIRRFLSINDACVKKPRKVKMKEKKEKTNQYGINCERPDLPESEIVRKKALLLERLLSSQQNRSDIEKKTRCGANPDLRSDLVRKTIPSEFFGRICKMRASTSRKTIVKEILYPSGKSMCIKHYIQEEMPRIRDEVCYELAAQSSECGVLIDEGESYLVTSPTALLDEDGLLEIYCPYTAKDMTPEEAIEKGVGDLHKIFRRDDITQMNESHNFYFNIQGALHIAQRGYCIFVVGTRKGMHWVGVYRDDDFWLKKMEGPLRAFYFDSFMFEVIDSRFERGMSIRDSVDVQKKIIARNVKRKGTFDNGLYRDPQYYLFNQHHDFIMCKYDSQALAPLVGKPSLLLLSREYARCTGKHDISSDLMDSYMIIKSTTTWANAQFILSAHTAFMLGNMSDQSHGAEWHMYNLDWNFEGQIFLPYVRERHWCLIVLDVENGTITHYDPMVQGETSRSREAMSKFQKYLTACEAFKPHLLCYLIWTVCYETEPRPIQTDGYNCGIYVMYLMDCLARHIPFDVHFDPDAYRLELQHLLLEESQSMKNTCLNCWNEKSKPITFTCISCQRWAHQTCKNSPVDDNSHCTLCSAYFTS